MERAIALFEFAEEGKEDVGASCVGRDLHTFREHAFQPRESDVQLILQHAQPRIVDYHGFGEVHRQCCVVDIAVTPHAENAQVLWCMPWPGDFALGEGPLWKITIGPKDGIHHHLEAAIQVLLQLWRQATNKGAQLINVHSIVVVEEDEDRFVGSAKSSSPLEGVEEF